MSTPPETWVAAPGGATGPPPPLPPSWPVPQSVGIRLVTLERGPTSALLLDALSRDHNSEVADQARGALAFFGYAPSARP